MARNEESHVATADNSMSTPSTQREMFTTCCNINQSINQSVFTARCTIVQSAVLRSHVVCLSVCDVGGGVAVFMFTFVGAWRGHLYDSTAFLF